MYNIKLFLCSWITLNMFVHFWSAYSKSFYQDKWRATVQTKCLLAVSVASMILTYYSHYNVFVYPVYPVHSGQIHSRRVEKTEQMPKPLLQIASPPWSSAPRRSLYEQLVNMGTVRKCFGALLHLVYLWREADRCNTQLQWASSPLAWASQPHSTWLFLFQRGLGLFKNM